MHVGTVFSCQKCRYTLKSKRGLKSHVKSHHEGKIYPCSECDQVFAYVGDMNLHKRSKHEGVVYFCKYCSHTENHKQYAHLKEDVPTCSICEKIFQRQGALKRHKQSHRWKAPYMLLMWQRDSETGPLWQITQRKIWVFLVPSVERIFHETID